MKRIIAILAIVMMSSGIAAKHKDPVGADGLTQKQRSFILNQKNGFNVSDCTTAMTKNKKQYGQVLDGNKMKCFLKKHLVSNYPSSMRIDCKTAIRNHKGSFDEFCKWDSKADRCIEDGGKIRACPGSPDCDALEKKYGSLAKYCSDWTRTGTRYRYCLRGSALEACPQK